MIGEEVRRRRETLRLTGAQLAQRAGLAPSAVSQIETGRRTPSSASVLKLAEGLGVEVGELYPKKAQAPLPLEESERGVTWTADILERFLGTWERQVREKENHHQSRTIAIAALDVQDAVTFNYRPEWDALPHEEKLQRHALAKRIDALVLDAFDHYKQAKNAEAEEIATIQRRREEMRRLTREISA